VIGDTTIECRFPTPTDTLRSVSRVETPTERRANARSTPPGPAPEIPGSEVLELLGRGAFGAVWKARPVGAGAHGSLVAIKVLRAAEELGDEERQRFLREADLAGVLDHPNVVRVLDRGEMGRVLYIVMEFVRGETLGALIERQGQLPVAVALQITRQIASALEVARAHGIVHRDVKPDNILLRDDGVAKLGDFGFAKSVLQGVAPGLTQVGEVVGTIHYMSPEQLECSIAADHRSDLYSLGATLYHMLAGRPPFGGSRSNVELFLNVLHKPPAPLERVRNDVPPIVAALVQRCVDKRPQARYASAGELARIAGRLLAPAERRETLA
jgi:serine/threonine-protein kinase